MNVTPRDPPDMSQNLQTARFKLRFATACQTARKAFDLTRFGNGPLERIGSSFVLGAAFFTLTVAVCVMFRAPSAVAIRLV